MLGLGCLLLTFLCLSSSIHAAQPCFRNCQAICPSAACQSACQQTCSKAVSRFYGKPYFRASPAFSLPAGTQITGSDAPMKPANSNIYFTTLGGTVYRYDWSVGGAAGLNAVFVLNNRLLAGGEGKGLYDIAFNIDYNLNGLAYLQYAEPAGADAEIVFIPDEKHPDLLSRLVPDHYNVIVQIESLGDMNWQLSARPPLRRLVQYSSARSGGWLKAGMREFYRSLDNTTRLNYAVGGNPEELALLVRHAPHLSIVGSFIPELTGSRNDVENVDDDKLWAAGIRNPIACASSPLYKVDYIYCMVEETFGNQKQVQRSIFKLKRGVNYGSHKYAYFCQDKLCAGYRTPMLSAGPLLSWAAQDECPMHSMRLYTGSKLNRNFAGQLFVVCDAYYNVKTSQFVPTALLLFNYDTINGIWRLSDIPTAFDDDDLLVNTTLLGGDLQDRMLIAGYSLRRSEMVAYHLDPEKAGDMGTTAALKARR